MTRGLMRACVREAPGSVKLSSNFHISAARWRPSVVHLLNPVCLSVCLIETKLIFNLFRVQYSFPLHSACCVSTGCTGHAFFHSQDAGMSMRKRRQSLRRLQHSHQRNALLHRPIQTAETFARPAEKSVRSRHSQSFSFQETPAPESDADRRKTDPLGEVHPVE